MLDLGFGAWDLHQVFSLLFIPIYDDLPNISQIGVCEKFVIKGLPQGTFSKF
jgi:hypothetical protein